MSDDKGWNPMPDGWRKVVPTTARDRGEEAWRLMKDGHVTTCVRFNEEQIGAGWEVVIKIDDEWVFGRRCEDQGLARFVANGLKQDHLRAGWNEAT
jgi:hypothetical protein